MSTDTTDTKTATAADPATTKDAATEGAVTGGATTEEVTHPDVQEGRSRLTLPPLSPDPAEALAAAEAAKTEPDVPAPPTYAEMLHLLPR